jgi:Ran GTPase-activating protein (RanGAP) involved in mRNA processing and transport
VQCTSLAYLCLYDNQIGDAEAQSFAGVLAQCPELDHLDLRKNDIKADAGKRLRASWRGQVVLQL